MPCAQSRLLLDEVTRVHRPAHFDGVTYFEELGAAALRIGKQRFDARAARRRHLVYGDVAHVQKLGDGAAVMVVRRIGGSGSLDADFFRTKRDGSGAANRELGCRGDANRTQAIDSDGYHAVAALAHRARQQIDVADEVRHEARLREAIDLRRFVELLDTSLVHYGDAVGKRQRLG